MTFKRQVNQTLYRAVSVPFYFFRLLPSMLTLTDFTVVTRRWHLSQFGFIWFFLNKANRLYVQFSNLLKTLCVYIWIGCVWCTIICIVGNITLVFFQKACHKCLYWKKECLISNLADLHNLHQRRSCKNPVFLFFVFFW